MDDMYLMACGHIANAKEYETNKPVCIICDCDKVIKVVKKDSYKDRIAKCTECGKETQSNPHLAFFKYEPDKEYDSYYCGCYGWD